MLTEPISLVVGHLEVVDHRGPAIPVGRDPIDLLNQRRLLPPVGVQIEQDNLPRERSVAQLAQIRTRVAEREVDPGDVGQPHRSDRVEPRLDLARVHGEPRCLGHVASRVPGPGARLDDCVGAQGFNELDEHLLSAKLTVKPHVVSRLILAIYKERVHHGQGCVDAGIQALRKRLEGLNAALVIFEVSLDTQVAASQGPGIKRSIFTVSPYPVVGQ